MTACGCIIKEIFKTGGRDGAEHWIEYEIDESECVIKQGTSYPFYVLWKTMKCSCGEEYKPDTLHSTHMRTEYKINGMPFCKNCGSEIDSDGFCYCHR